MSTQFKDAASVTDDKPKLVLVVGSKPFGYSDAPFYPAEVAGSIRAIVPTALLMANPTLLVKPLFTEPRYFATWPPNYSPYAQIERIVLLEKGKDASSYLLFGSRLDEVKILGPDGIKLEPGPDKATIRCFTLKTAQVDGIKQILIQRGTERPFLVSLPAAAPKAGDDSSGMDGSGDGATDGGGDSAKPTVKAKAPVPVGDDQATFTGTNLGGLTKVLFGEKPLAFDPAKDGKSVIVKGLKAGKVTDKASSQELSFVFKAATVKAKLEVVAKKTEPKK